MKAVRGAILNESCGCELFGASVRESDGGMVVGVKGGLLPTFGVGGVLQEKRKQHSSRVVSF